MRDKVNVDVFKEFYWCVVFIKNNLDEHGLAYENIYEYRTREKLWFDKEKVID